MSTLQLVILCCQWSHSRHWDGSLAPSFAHQSMAVVFRALDGLPLCLCRNYPSDDPTSTIRGWDVYSLASCVASVILCLMWVRVSQIVSVNAKVSQDTVDLGFNAVGAEGPGTLIDCSCWCLPRAWVQVRRPSDSCLRITRNCYCWDSYCPEVRVKHLDLSCTEVAANDRPAVCI